MLILLRSFESTDKSQERIGGFFEHKVNLKIKIVCELKTTSNNVIAKCYFTFIYKFLRHSKHFEKRPLL